MTISKPEQTNVLVLYPGSVFLEVAEALSSLRSAGKLVVATANGRNVRVEEGFSVEADTSFAALVDRKFRSLIIPGGDCYDVFHNDDLMTLIQVAVTAKVVVGGICNGALLLAKAGVLSGKRCTHTCIPKYAPLPEFQELLDAATPVFASSTYVDEDIVRDGQIVTAKPWASKAFSNTLSEMLVN
jgi:putative intracellular protease/amidase